MRFTDAYNQREEIIDKCQNGAYTAEEALTAIEQLNFRIETRPSRTNDDCEEGGG